MHEITSMMEETSENSTDLSADDIGTIEENPDDSILSRQGSVDLVPFIGQRFVSQEAAYEFYCSYAKQCGFSVRRYRTRGKDGVGKGVTRRDFICHLGGYAHLKPSEVGQVQRNRKSSRCGCQAYMRIVRRSDVNVPEWCIIGFSNDHNHELSKSMDVQMLLPANCAMSADDKSRICMFAKAGMSVRQMLRLMELEKGVKLGGLQFTEIDVRNLLQSFRTVDRDNYAIDLLKMCKDKKDKDPNFQYDFKLDANNHLDHIAWSYGSSVQTFESFGDVVIFDTTHRLDAYDMLLGIWVGVDNYGSNCFFGCVLLRDESLQSFCWALKAFIGFMNGKAPETILTDQNMWLKEALAIEMPRTKHAFCIWHVVAKFSDWFSVLLGPQYDQWRSDFHRLYNMHSVDEFELGWREMVNNYGLHGNKHILSLYALRTFWALPFLRCYFFAGMTSTFQLDSVNTLIQRFLSAQSVLVNFVEQVEVVMDAKDQVSLKQKMIRSSQKVSLKTGSPLESHAAAVLTPYAFCKLQEQLVLAPQYASLLVDGSYFIVRHHTEMNGGYKVLWTPHDECISCSCHDFEFSGILCRHVLRVLSTNNCFHIPFQYLPIRWRDSSNYTKPLIPTAGQSTGNVQMLQSMASSLVSESMETDERLSFACDQIKLMLSRLRELPGSSNCVDDMSYNNSPPDSLVHPEVDSDSIVQSFCGNPHESLNIGRLKERMSDNLGKRRRCSVPCCGQFGHDSDECSLLGSDMNGDGLGFL